MPGDPIEMPSDTVMVLNSTPLPPALLIPASVSRASSLMCMLHGVRLAQVEAMPTCGRAKSASVKPTARSIALDGVCFAPSTTSRDQRRGSLVFVVFMNRSTSMMVAKNSQPKRVAMSRSARRRHCASAPTGRPGRSRGFHANKSTCAQLRPGETNRRKNNAP